jgi:acetyl-CoA carboxylase carboxyl transferase subunit beta
MAWFQRAKSGIKTGDKKDMPHGLWLKCDGCGEILYRPEMEKAFWTCHKCDYHFSIGSRQYIKLLVDEDSFVEEDAELGPDDPLGFKDSKKYGERIAIAQKKTGLSDAIVAGKGAVRQLPVSIAALDFGYMGGSMGSVFGYLLLGFPKPAIY